MRTKHLIVWFLVTVIAVLAAPAVDALAQAPFYQGKTLVIVLGTAPGGAGDNRTRALVPSLRKYIPGNPTIVLEHRAGAGGREAGRTDHRGFEWQHSRAERPRRNRCHVRYR
jgi:tripartite-type tricarboxylate transporter receptor subunit TctC